MRHLTEHGRGILAIAVALLIIMGVEVRFLGSLAEDEEKIFEDYCNMVDLHSQSSGENGWPDYKKQYLKLCMPDDVTEERGAAPPSSGG